MKIIESKFSNDIIKFVHNKLGNIFFFKDIAVVELNEGVHFDMNNAPLIINELKSYFGETKPFGIVANRVNSYSVDLLSTPKYREQLKNLKAYSVVGHDRASKVNAKMENDFCGSDKVDFNSLYDAINYVDDKVRNSNLFSLN